MTGEYAAAFALKRASSLHDFIQKVGPLPVAFDEIATPAFAATQATPSDEVFRYYYDRTLQTHPLISEIGVEAFVARLRCGYAMWSFVDFMWRIGRRDVRRRFCRTGAVT